MIDMLMTHGGRKAKRFSWAIRNDCIEIENENKLQHQYSLTEINAILFWLKDRFGAEWFPLANNVEKLWHDEEVDGLGVSILRQQPRNISHAQGSSYLGVVLEQLGILEWNDRHKGIEWRIIRQVPTLNKLRKAIEATLA